MTARTLPAGWLWDPCEEEHIADTCPNCGAVIDDDTEVFYDVSTPSPERVGCEACMATWPAYQAAYHEIDTFQKVKSKQQ